MLPSGAYQGAEKPVVKAIEKNIDPIRRTLAEMDKTGDLRKVNTDIRLLMKLIGGKEKGFLTKAAEKDILSQIFTKGTVTAGAASLLPGVGQFITPIAGAEAITSIPQVSAPLARGITAMQKSNLTPKVLNSAKNVVIRGINR